MGRSEKNRQFILEFYKVINGKDKPKEILALFIADPRLIEHLTYLEKLLPKFMLIPEEITTENDRVIVRAQLKGQHTGTVEGIRPTQNNINTTFAAGYRIEHERIIDHWFISDQIELMKQLGLAGHLDKMPNSNPDL